MQTNDSLYNEFLEELNALEKFRMSYSGTHSCQLLGRDDPDVKRLIEAIAFFNARTRSLALESILNTRRRMFEQFFSFLLSPLPTMAILQADCSGHFTEPFILPKHSEILVKAAQDSEIFFRTLFDLKVLPISLKKAELVLGTQQNFRILLNFYTPYPRNDSIGMLSLYLNYLNDYDASLKFLYAFKKHFKKCWVSFEEKITEYSQGKPCEISFGALKDVTSTTNADISHPLEKVRTFFHFPQQELYININVPEQPRNWKQFTIVIDLDSKWPKTFNIHRDIFQLFTVPIMNIKQSMAQPFLSEGTQDIYPVRYPDPKKQFAVHSILGVYRIEKQGLIPLRPGILVGGNGSYEIEYSRSIGITNIVLNLPESFVEPQKIAIEALWIQPSLSEKLSQIVRILPTNRKVEGLSWDILGKIRLHQENPLKDDAEGLLQFLSLQKKSIFDLQEILFLLKSLGCLYNNRFQEISSFLQDVQVNIIPQSKKIGGIKYVYHITFKEFELSYRPFVELFLKHTLILLQTCSADSTVALKVRLSTQEVLDFE